MSTETESAEPGTGCPRAVDDDGHLWVEMEPDSWVSWFDRRRYRPGSGMSTQALRDKWARRHGLGSRPPYAP